MLEFPSKIDKWTNLILWLLISIPVWVFLANIYTTNSLHYLQLILIPISGLLLWIRLKTVYIIDGQLLKYQSGPIRGQIDIQHIYKIHRTTNDPFNSGNLSLDKISIRARKRGGLNISPIRKEEFIASIVAINPTIEVVD